MGGGSDLCHGNRFECLLHRFHELDRLATAIRTNGGRTVYRTQQHLFAATRAGQQPNPDFDQTRVEFGMRLASSSVQRNLSAPSKG